MDCKHIMSTEIYLLRHGETEWNKEGRLQGRGNSPLTTLGRRQAEELGKLLARTLDGVQLPLQVSPLGRARETAAIIREFLPGPEPVIEPRIQEMTLGEWEGMMRTDVNERWNGIVGADKNAEWWFHAPRGETYDAFKKRVDSWLSEQKDPVIAVSHGITTRLIRGAYLGLSRAESLALPVPHGVIWRLAEGKVETLS
jgi:probable phosphoglycerate mutase